MGGCGGGCIRTGVKLRSGNQWGREASGIGLFRVGFWGKYKGRLSSYGRVTNGEGRHQVLGGLGFMFLVEGEV